MIPRRFPVPALDQYIYYTGMSHDGQTRCIITFAGHVDAERMARAVRLVLDAEPILGCRFVEHPWRPYWERRDDLDIIPLCPVVETKDVESELFKFMAAPMDPSKDLQVQATIFRADRDTLCIKVTHTVADGAGTLDCVGLLARTHRELIADPAYCPQPNLFGSRGHGQVLRRVGPLSLIRACCRYSRPHSRWKFPVTSQDFSGRAFIIRRIEPERLACIKSYCQRHRVTVNDVLLTAFYRALSEVLAPPVNMPLPVAATVNLRRHLPSGQAGAICNLSGYFYPAISLQLGANFDDMLSQIHAATEAAKANRAWLGEAVFLELAFLPGFWLGSRILHLYYHRTAREAAFGRSLPWLTNVGVIDHRCFNFGDVMPIDVAMFGPVLYQPRFGLGVTTFCDRMNFTIRFCDTATDVRIVERFLDLFMCELPE